MVLHSLDHCADMHSVVATATRCEYLPIHSVSAVMTDRINMTDTSDSIQRTTEFFMELDKLKLVNRRSYIAGGERLENSAEHSWHLALACWLFVEKFKLNVNTEVLLKMALVHDLGEIDAGDTFLYSEKRPHVSDDERNGVKRIAELPGNAIADLLAVWDSQECGETPEARVLKVVDRLLPFNHNINSHGRAWVEHGVKKSQVLAAHSFIGDELPIVFEWMEQKIEYAVEQGWLQDG